MSFTANLPLYLSGAFAGICLLMLVLSLIVGYAYNEPMLWWHAASLVTALLALLAGEASPEVSTMLWTAQLALSGQSLRALAGSRGAMQKPAIALRVVSVAILLLAVSRLISGNYFIWLLPAWIAVTGWYLFRTWNQTRPWVYWLTLGQLALASQWLIQSSVVQLASGGVDLDTNVASLAALAVFATSTYLAMVWFSRRRAENALRVEARERTDPLTGLATQRVFLDRVDGGLLRSRNLGYACALILIRVENIEKIASDQSLDNNEAVILGASRAIAHTLRAQDTAARLSGNRFGVMAEGIAEGMGTEMATKILAQGLRAEECGLRGSELQFQIAVIEVVQPDIDSTALFQQLEEVLREMTSKSSPSRIRTLARITPRQTS